MLTRHQSITDTTPLLRQDSQRRMRSYTTGDLVAQHNRRVRMNSAASSYVYDNDQSSILTAYHSIRDYVKERYPSLTTRKFIAAVIWSLVAVGIFNLIFLPRTSLGRDYRRIHFSSLSKDDTERLFIKSLNDENRAGDYLQEYMNRRHVSGDGDKMVQYTMETLREFGLKPYKEVYYSWMTRHIDSSLELIHSNDSLIYRPTLLEQNLVTGEYHQGYHAYSASGKITSEYIYANYGTVDDYNLLEQNGVDVKSKIHIIRKGHITTALQIHHAELHGAVGIITYVDPYDDGRITEGQGYKPYPRGLARNPRSIRRDTVLKYTNAPGDPTTVGYPSLRPVKRMSPKNIPQVPSIPMSLDEITPILQHLTSGSSLNWTGDVPGFDYNTGPSSHKIHLENSNKGEIVPIKNIMYEIPGLLNEKVILGSHRDSLTTQGAGNPGSGTAILLEISRAFASLLERGWRPLRTIVVASWDGSEYGMLGSTEFGERYSRHLQESAIAYINLDMGVTGHEIDVVSNPLLDHFLVTTSKDIPFLNYSDSKSLFDYWQETQPVNKIKRLGSGSDFSVFQHHLGIPSCDVGFHADPKLDPPVPENSLYDTLDWIHKIDPDYLYHNTLAKYLGFLALTFSEHEVIEYKVSHYADEIMTYFHELESKIPEHWCERTVKFMKRDSSLSLMIDQIKSSLHRFSRVASEFDKTASELQKQISVDYPWFNFYTKLRLAWDSKLLGNKAKEIDQMFLYGDGLKKRPWMQHLIFAPNRDNGVVPSFLPLMNESLTDDKFDDFLEGLRALLAAVKRATIKLKL